MSQPEQILKVQNQLGETPIWEPDERALYWVDWGAGLVCRYQPELGQFTSFDLDVPVTAIARRASGGWVLIAQNGIYVWDSGTDQCEMICGRPDPENLNIIFNDGAVDLRGRLLVGTVNMEEPFSPEGSLYRLDPDLSLHQLDRDYATANGIGFSPDSKTIYVADQRKWEIIALDYDLAQGTVSNRRVFARVPEDEGMPDGLIVDQEGYIWSGHWGGWRLTRYAPDGTVERQVRFPVEHVISFAFGGPELDELFVTTS
ncbi:MAG TPA: SMP-30/gluconolactonase/LRE family protein, partial [Anaerolineales bacterium]|nr:SMP-30/gluconolactonase/LRE family protein [Anaerolineales bacterium]